MGLLNSNSYVYVHTLEHRRFSFTLACVAWRFKQLSASVQSGKAAKMSGKAARNRLPGLPAFFIAAPITYFDNPMTGFFFIRCDVCSMKAKLKACRERNREKCKR